MDAQWVKTQFDLNPEKTKAGLADALRLSASAVSKILKGTRQIKAHEYAAMRIYFGLPSHHDRAERRDNSYVLQPLRESDTKNTEEWVIPANVLSQRTGAPSGEVKIYKVEEKAMEPDFTQGAHVLVDQSDTSPSPPGMFVISDGFGHMLRQCELVTASSPQSIKISAKDPSYKSQTIALKDIQIFGRVIAKLQWV